MGERASEETYNIIPIHNLLADHPSLRYPEVRAACAALRSVGDLRRPPFIRWQSNMDILDWLGAFFGFQRDNVRNQREHLILLLANAQMRIQPDNVDSLDPSIVHNLRHKLLRNYCSWCSFLGRKANVWINENRGGDPRRELLYISLYLLIWGEAANLRFVPECLCYIFHHMTKELNWILEGKIDENTGQAFTPHLSGENSFLDRIVKPIYDTIKAEVDSSRNGTAPHSAWRNYDDINEYFWTERCFKMLSWPIDLSSSFFATSKSKAGKTGFVERRSFWNIFRSFDRLWIMHILFLQAAIIIAWDGEKTPWASLTNRDIVVKILTIFITWAGLRFILSVLDAIMQYRLVSREMPWLGARMVLKCVFAVVWIGVFSFLYVRIRNQRNKDPINQIGVRLWSIESNRKLRSYVVAVVAFLVPEILALILFTVPWIWNAIEKSNWKIFCWMTWWFRTRTFVGRGLREGIWDTTMYSLFWIGLLFFKFSFSYFLQIKPMIAPTKAMLKINKINYKWHQIFDDTSRIGIGILWAPVVLIYLTDMQIWYSIFSSVVGALVGLLSHLGEIRNVEQLRLRFQFFASAMQFHLIPKEQLFESSGSFTSKIEDAINRLKLRYGLGQPYKKIESSQVNARKFSLIWNEIITSFREEDILSDHEMELLELPANAWGIKVIRWPCLLLCNELLLALGQAKEIQDSDKKLWHKICKYEYRKCAVIEVYCSLKYLFERIVMERTEERSIIKSIFSEIDCAIQLGKMTTLYKMSVLPQIHTKIISLVQLLIMPNKDVNKVVNLLQTLYDIMIRDFPRNKRSNEELKQDGLVPQRTTSADLLFVNAVELPEEGDTAFYRNVRRLHTILTSRDSMNNVPLNLEARRRIAFFSNSLFMNMPRAPPVDKMLAFSVLTPYYEEEVLFSKEQLRTENEDGVSILFYLQKIYDDEWKNFMERMRRNGMLKEKDMLSDKLRDLRIWASYRGQTLSRTVRGMMYYYRALKMLAFLDTASEMDIRDGSQELDSFGFGSSRREDGPHISISDRYPSSRTGLVYTETDSGIDHLYKGHEYGTATMKFTYVVACQLYGKQKAKKDHRADDILYLMKNNEALRVAYVDEVNTGRDNAEYYSVLVKYDQQLQQEVEIFRIKLPGQLKLGEGKPENQNHAIIFTRGDAVQTIDMNQDNYFEESLKMRNLLEEFNVTYGSRKPTILGVREHIFTGSVSSLAWFMSAQETSFVTLGQRVLANPLKIRMHYGHPDVFDRLWFLSRGGISKASRVINISEDIFAGFNCTLRGGNVTHHEYIQVGKGRDVGLNQISLFEAKVASGNGEQILSRDVYRLAHRLDFFRMLSFFYTTIGFFFNSMMIVLTVYAFIWGRFYLALSGVEDALSTDSSNNRALGTILNQQFIIQLGLFTALPMVVENSLEHGFVAALWDFLTMQLQLSSVFYTFSLGTRAHYFGRTVLHGGAKYQATGRGFVVQHKGFTENYRLYARTHYIKGIELGVLLIFYTAYSSLAKNTFVFIAMTIATWFLIISWILGPSIFNPSGFDWLKAVNDFDHFMNWIWYKGGVLTKSEQCWESWWREQYDHLRNTGLWGALWEVILDLRFFFFQYAIVYQLRIANSNTSISIYLLSWIYVFVAVLVFMIATHAREKYAAREHIYYRAVQFFIICVAILAIIALFKFTKFEFIDLLTSLMAFIPTGWGFICISQVFRPILEGTMIWDSVISIGRLYDILFGVIVMFPTALLSWLPGFQEMQTRILFNEAFSRGLQISRILIGKKRENK